MQHYAVRYLLSFTFWWRICLLAARTLTFAANFSKRIFPAAATGYKMSFGPLKIDLVLSMFRKREEIESRLEGRRFGKGTVSVKAKATFFFVLELLIVFVLLRTATSTTLTATALRGFWRPTTRAWRRCSSTDPPTSLRSLITWPGMPCGFSVSQPLVSRVKMCRWHSLRRRLMDLLKC